MAVHRRNTALQSVISLSKVDAVLLILGLNKMSKSTITPILISQE